MSKYQKYWATPNQEAKAKAFDMRDEMYSRAVAELDEMEEPFKSPAWARYCQSDAEFDAIVDAAIRVLERFGSQEKAVEWLDLVVDKSRLMHDFGLTAHDLKFVRDALITRPGRLMPSIELDLDEM